MVTQTQVPDNKFNAHPDPIANALDLTPNTAPLVVTKESRVVEVVESDQTTENDVKYARENLYHLAEKGKDVLSTLKPAPLYKPKNIDLVKKLTN